MEVKQIARVRSCFKQKFGVPRQPRLTPSSYATVIMEPEFSDPQAFEGLEEIKHLWLITGFHLNEGWSLRVRPPRLGGNKSLGVFATRSPFRPNPLGLSLVDLEKLEYKNGQMHIHIRNHDLVDGTPIYDIKPYHYWIENIEGEAGWFKTRVEQKFQVQVSPEIKDQLLQLKKEDVIFLLEETLAMDPRPQYKGEQDSKDYFVQYDDFEFSWKVEGEIVNVFQMRRIS
jgi:tRNA-Thr(GGU) m(6)t(6)A37 methyltransferase TsaA